MLTFCTVTVNASLTLYSAPVAYFCDSVTLIYACIIIIIIILVCIVLEHIAHYRHCVMRYINVLLTYLLISQE